MLLLVAYTPSAAWQLPDAARMYSRELAGGQKHVNLESGNATVKRQATIHMFDEV